jgi:hypothetical protein
MRGILFYVAVFLKKKKHDGITEVSKRRKIAYRRRKNTTRRILRHNVLCSS